MVHTVIIEFDGFYDIEINLIFCARHYAYHFNHNEIYQVFEKVSHFDKLSRLDSLRVSSSDLSFEHSHFPNI